MLTYVELQKPVTSITLMASDSSISHPHKILPIAVYAKYNKATASSMRTIFTQ